jgi:hypothetical protein
MFPGFDFEELRKIRRILSAMDHIFGQEEILGLIKKEIK